MADILLIFPRVGYGDLFIKDPPLALLYASSIAVKDGFTVKIVDQRNCYKNWKQIIEDELKAKPMIAGLSVMTGRPIHYAIEISKFIKQLAPKTAIVWGGHHPTILPENTLDNPFIDFLIRGAGSIPLAALAETLRNSNDAFDDIPGLSYKKNQKLIHNQDIISYEKVPFQEIPYHLVDMNSYHRLGNKNIFVIMTSFGCPHDCSFCYAPLIYRNRRWAADSPQRTVDHMQMAINRFKVDSFSIIDDNFFVDMKRAKDIFEMIKEKRWKVSFQLRGVRIDDLDRMNDEMLLLMEDVNVRHIMIGAESASDRILKLMNKKITINQIIRVSRKLVKYPKIVPMYNLLTGIPGEVLSDMKKTVDLMRQLVKENPCCEISMLEHFLPLPGTKLFTIAKEKGFSEPQTLETWSKFESETRADHYPWLTNKQRRYIRIMQVASLFIDNKIKREIKIKRFEIGMLVLFSYLYRFIARFRVKFHISVLPAEYYMLRCFNRLIEKMTNLDFIHKKR
ncbi:MAG: B12-binding domain-containing radical SAM protein [Candidatus Omnitrophica bacterium]|nr:B12-binding domain-containing radical SAM protein [Candidatus Omnitrophota bacterium]MCK5393040.1 B12-binding domain-containing radical SAM protein [Candidatus Omnitrophota bacterium]